MLSWVAPCGFTTPLSCELRRLGFSLPLHCSALFNHGQVTPFIVYIAAFGRFMRRSRIPKHSRRYIYSRCEMRSCGAGMHRSAAEGRFGVAEPVGRASVCAGAQTIGVEFRAVTFRTRVYSWTRHRLDSQSDRRDFPLDRRPPGGYGIVIVNFANADTPRTVGRTLSSRRRSCTQYPFPQDPSTPPLLSTPRSARLQQETRRTSAPRRFLFAQ